MMHAHDSAPAAICAPAAPATAARDWDRLPDDAVVGVDPVAQVLDCSVRHIWRMADAGLMPAPLKLGRLRRWRVGTIRQWIAGGCKPARTARRASA